MISDLNNFPDYVKPLCSWSPNVAFLIIFPVLLSLCQHHATLSEIAKKIRHSIENLSENKLVDVPWNGKLLALKMNSTNRHINQTNDQPNENCVFLYTQRSVYFSFAQQKISKKIVFASICFCYLNSSFDVLCFL